ncbi:hypothetical protein OQJ26_00605 [Legionella sp. PATHC038]|uniref:hypothetical protein n=1 Tax=Legionella sheltonii TaxID=2992041 RepID=UPI002242CDEA|nr:hypothetical protein [Legionella sp. PATHC038]MCW8397293.1 hypothetical protein [Legionella sp. PATHC038]
MAKNTLFNFLSQNESIVQLPQGHKLILGFNKSSQHYYYRIELPIEKFSIKDQENMYTLDNHHLSVYENENRQNPKLSQYHYTAEFINQSGERYRLHVYFNAFDELIQNIAFEKATVDGYKLIDSTHMRNQLIILALRHTEPLINQLRQRHQEKIKDLETDYKDCDQRLLKYFDSEQQNTTEILEITEEACGVLKELIPLIRSSSYVEALRFHEATARSLKKPHTTSIELITSTPSTNEDNHVEDVAKEAPSPQDEASLKDEPSSHDKAAQKEDNSSHEEVTQSTKTKVLIIDQLAEELRELNTQFEELSKASSEVQAKKIEQLLAKTYEINLTYERHIRLKDLHQLQNIRRKLQKLEADLLPSLLFGYQFELAALLTSSHHLLRAEKFLTVALQTNNSRLLDFILTYSDIDINNQRVTVFKKSFASAVHACLQEDSPSHPMNECLSVLIKHGASLFAPDNKGLPLVYSILTGETHPLRKALFMNRDRTIESIDFFKKLNALLRVYLTKETLSLEDKKAIESELKSFEDQLENLQNLHMEDPSSRFLMKRVNHLEEKYIGAILRQLRQDPEVMNLNKRVLKASAELNSKLSKHQRRQANIFASNQIQGLEKILGKVDVMSFGFDFLKARALEGINNNLQLIQKKSELLDIQKEILTYRNKKANRKYRDLMQQQTELLQEIKELENESPMLQNFEALDNSLEALDSLEQALKSLGEELQPLKGISALLNQFSSIFSFPNSTTADSATETDEDKENNEILAKFEKDLEDLQELLNKPSSSL